MYFYELHEGDDEVYSDVLLMHEAEYEPEEFFELVQSIRRRIQGSFEDDTLIEAIAAELEREHDFLFVSDDKLTAAVNISRAEDDNFLARVDADEDDSLDDDDDDDDDEEDEEDAAYRTIYADAELDGNTRPN